MARSRLLAIIEQVLREREAPLSARALVPEVRLKDPDGLSGQTPWKTIGARLAVDIRRNPATPFLRVGSGLYGLREWPDTEETVVPPRRIHPLDEDILAVPSSEFLNMLAREKIQGIYDLDYLEILAASQVVPRRNAEETEEFVQIIPSFVILRGNEILSYKRTKKTPENRLHDTRTIVFGGHLQASDIPSLFAHERSVVIDFIFRELYEELRLSPEAKRYLYLGALHLSQTAFERQHVGLVFILEAPTDAAARSLEPGYHSGLRFMNWNAVLSSSVMNDRWSQVCMNALGRNS